ncbi:YeeE/YedE family protein [Pseudoroseicyclus tamaricis]|uniref:YeeE/YedE family protein n=1 Tax=Pseudoroseicyclus tamaricis TaxID=2705421 RepID=A0A6B2JP64_9RHOB|nr:YeeE/YedE family protein [Pseudoroseicyclus tamaricis]NDU99857.1 YeeE/YedE family protein [Pseudoroseicyclus tamaricis]
MKQLFALLSGLLFGAGLILSGMSDPAKVLNFLDIFGSWDPSLAFVMGGAILVTAPGYALLTRARSRPLFDTAFRIPTRRDLDARLISGAVIFGVGWGLGGFCPGPALTALPLAASGTLIFVPFMLAGMWAARRVPDLSLTAKGATR